MKTVMFRTARLFLFTVAIIAGLVSSAHALELVSADVHPETYPTVQAVKHMGAALSKRTGGKLTISIAHSGKLGTEADSIARVRSGQQAMARLSLGQFTEQIPEVRAISLPFLFRNVAHMQKAMDGPIGKDIAQPFEKLGFIVLAYYDAGARSMYTHSRPVRGPEDLKGMKIRVQAGMFEEMISALGANAQVIPYHKVLESLQEKSIDGAENNWPSFVTSGHYDVARYITITEHSITPEVLVMSKVVWDGLSATDRQHVLDSARESVPVMRRLWNEAEAASRATAEKSGVKIIELLNYDRIPFTNAMRPLYKKVLVTEEQRALVKRIQKTY